MRSNFERVNIEDKKEYGSYGGTVKATGDVSPLEWGKAAAEFARDMPGRSQIRIIFEDTNGNAFSTKFMDADSAEDMDAVSHHMGKLLENGSYRTGGGGGIGKVSYQTNSQVGGGAGKKLPAWLMAKVDGEEKPKPCIWQVINDDGLCGQRALSVGLVSSARRLRMKKDTKLQLKEAKKVCKAIEVDGEMNVLDFDKFAAAYKRRVVIMCSREQVMHVSGDEFDVDTSIYIFYDITEQHYHLITSMTPFS